MSLRIARVVSRIVNHPIRPERVVVSPAGKHDTSRFVIVTIENSDGVRGYGEAATVPGWSGESAETAQWMIEQVFGPALCKATLDHPSQAPALIDALAVNNSFAKGALDTAVWDLYARSQSIWAGDLLGDRPPVASIPTRASVGCYDVSNTVRIAREFWAAGIRTLKFKIGVPAFDDAARLSAVRDALGAQPIFTVDANGAYRSADDALRAIDRLRPYNLLLVEQPTHRDRLDLLAAVRRRAGLPIMADEAVFTPTQLDQAIDLDAFDLLSVYPGKNGGVTRTREMALSAQRAGKKCAIGSNLETDLGQAAMATLAACLSAFPVEELACDLPAVLYYEQAAVRQPLTFSGGRITVARGPGFGVEPLA